MRNYKKNNVKKLYMLLVLSHLIIIFFQLFLKIQKMVFYIAIQFTLIINTIIITSVCFWIVIESIVFFNKIKKNFINFRTFNYIKRFNYLNDFFKLILITVPIFISSEYKAIEYFLNSNQIVKSWEFFLIIGFSIIISATCLFISLFFIFEKIRKKIKFEITEKLFFVISKIMQPNLVSLEYINFTKELLRKFELYFITFLEKNNFVEQIINWKKSFHLKIFKKGVTPPSLIF
ncbi:hypothetical protein [Spiroplasma endosymbiont of Cantharis rufa]|uniref:hypothetical protein n=1 Tax=Spiroplasma endosymbiont of Cantharis rufa TaxID=3066279 RepID=UPI0030D4DD3B